MFKFLVCFLLLLTSNLFAYDEVDGPPRKLNTTKIPVDTITVKNSHLSSGPALITGGLAFIFSGIVSYEVGDVWQTEADKMNDLISTSPTPEYWQNTQNDAEQYAQKFKTLGIAGILTGGIMTITGIVFSGEPELKQKIIYTNITLVPQSNYGASGFKVCWCF